MSDGVKPPPPHLVTNHLNEGRKLAVTMAVIVLTVIAAGGNGADPHAARR